MVIILQVLVVVAVIFAAFVLIRNSARNKKLLARVRSEWGVPVEPRKLDDDLANEAWLDHSNFEPTDNAIDERT